MWWLHVIYVCMYFVAGGALVISPLTPFNETSDVSVNCVNQNAFFRGTPQWRTPDGSVINGSPGQVLATLAFSGVTRQQAGTYTCVVPGVPQVPTGIFELVVQCKSS